MTKQCVYCREYFERFSCGAWRGECDCPKCQGMCLCSELEEESEDTDEGQYT